MKGLSLLFFMMLFLSACGSKDANEGDLENQSYYKTGQMTLKSGNFELLVVQVPHPQEPVADGVILVVMDKTWAESEGENKVWFRMKDILESDGVQICNYDNNVLLAREDLTAATLVEWAENKIHRVFDFNMHSNHQQLSGSGVNYVEFTDGIITKVNLANDDNTFLFTADISSFQEGNTGGVDILEYVNLTSASRVGLNCP